MQQIIRAASLAAQAAQFKPAKRLPFHQGPGDAAVDVKIADLKGAFDLLDSSRTAGIETAGQGIAAVISEYERLLDILGPQDREHGAKDLFLGQRGVRWHLAKDSGAYEESIAQIRAIDIQDQLCLLLARLNRGEDTAFGCFFNDRSEHYP